MQDLNAPPIGRGRNPEAVSDQVVADEMAAFMAFSAEAR